jgi:hypothetical protein
MREEKRDAISLSESLVAVTSTPRRRLEGLGVLQGT